MKKIVIVGSAGAGKSTLSRQLGAILGIKVYHLDQIFWTKGWISISREELIKYQQQTFKQDSWIIDGNYSSTMDMRFTAADTIIFLNFPRARCLYRVVKRRIQYHKKTRPDMGEGCEERLDLEFLKWVWDYPKTRTPSLLARLEHLKDEKTIIVLHSPKEVKRFLEEISCHSL
ncbi:DNA topology modulation protein [Microbacteriaceae bacterium 4G12]